MKKKIAVLAFVMTGVVPRAFAGSTQVVLECASATGRTQVEAAVPGDEMGHSVRFTIDGDSSTMKSELDGPSDNAIQVFGDAKNGTLRFYIFANTSNGRELRLFGLEQTAGGRVNRTPNGWRGSINAKAQGQDPRYRHGEERRDPVTGELIQSESKEIQLSCSYVYEI